MASKRLVCLLPANRLVLIGFEQVSILYERRLICTPMNPANSKFAKIFRQIPFTLWQRAVLFSVTYFVFAEAGGFLSVRDSAYVSFWLPAGLYVSVLLLNERRAWPWLVLAAFPANLIFDLFHGTKFVHILVFYCANTVQAVTGAWLVSRFVAERPTLATL